MVDETNTDDASEGSENESSRFLEPNKSSRDIAIDIVKCLVCVITCHSEYFTTDAIHPAKPQ